MVRYRRYLIALAAVALLLGAYAAAGFLAVPHFARSAAMDFVRQHYGRTLQLGEIHFNPFTLTLDVTQAVLPDADGAPMLAFQRLHVDLQHRSLWRRGPSFREIRLQGPYVRAVLRPGGALNLADLGKGFPPQPPARKPAAPLRLFIQQFAVTAGSAEFRDRTRTPAFAARLAPIAFELRDFSTLAGSDNAYTLSAASAQGERFNWNGALQLAPLASQGKFEIADLRAATIGSYLAGSLPFDLASGRIGLKGDYQLTAGPGPLGLLLNVRDTFISALALRPRAAAQDYLRLERIEVGDTRLDLQRRSVEVGPVRLTGGEIHAWMDEQGRLNLFDLAGPPSKGGLTAPAGAGVPATPPATTASGTAAVPVAATAAAGPAAAWRVSAADIRISHLKVAAEDRQVKPAVAVTFDPLDLEVTGFNNSPGNSVDLVLNTAINSSGKLVVHGRVTPDSGAVRAQVEASSVALPVVQPYLSRYTALTLLSGSLGAKLSVERHADGLLDAAGDCSIADLRTVDNALRQDFIKWRELRIAGAHYRSRPQSVKVASVTAREPYVRMVIAPDRTVNVSKVLTAPGATAAAPRGDKAATAAATHGVSQQSADGQPAHATPAEAKATAQSPTLATSIAVVRIVNGSANYTDEWIKPSFSVGIQSLAGTITGLNSDPRSRAKVALTGKIDRYAPVNIDGDVNLLSAALYTDITMGFKDVDLTIVNPYSGHFAGYKIDKGKLSVDVTYKVDQRKLDAKQHFVVDQLQLGDRVESPDAVHLPLKIAVALLKDRDGVIDLDLPMKGTLDDPTFRIGPIIWKMFVNLIVKAATAPFALLGHLFGGGEHVNIISFAAGSGVLDKPGQDQAASLIKALQERPQLKLDVPIVWSVPVDGPALAAQRLQQRLLQRAGGQGKSGKRGRQGTGVAPARALPEDPAEHYRLLLEEFRAELGKDAPLPASAQAVQEAKRKETLPYEAAIGELTQALIDQAPATDADLEALGRQRAQSIQDALLGGGAIDPGRVFIVNAPPKPQGGPQVNVELAVK
ncbi:MAG: DUF748 domain-containing protein [Proteobacteria bacterium]|nr:DUF748 domain-containing protein [Pseudomonadota bacterium]